MNDQERVQRTDDLVVEIMDIPRVDGHRGNEEDAAVTPAQRPRFSPRQRRWQLVVTSGVVIVAIVLILASSVSARNLVLRVFVPPTPVVTPPLPSDINLFYIVGTPNWGNAFIDGRVVLHLPAVGVDQPLQLSRGQHELQWIAPPFLSQQCTISIPLPAASDGTGTCSLHEAVSLPTGTSAWVIRFNESLLTLPDPTRVSLIEAAQAVLDTQQSTDVVQPGEYYGYPTRNAAYSVAQQPLRARLRFQLQTSQTGDKECMLDGRNPGESCILVGQDCRIFCANPTLSILSPAPPAGAWNVLAVIAPVWDYTTLDNHVIAQNQLDGTGGVGYDASFLPLSITWTGTSWHVKAYYDNQSLSLYGDPSCDPAQDTVQSTPALRTTEVDTSALQWTYLPGSVHAMGCLVTASPIVIPVGTPASVPIPTAYCLYRFGLLVAINNLAHRLWPWLPVADTYEQHVAMRLLGKST